MPCWQRSGTGYPRRQRMVELCWLSTPSTGLKTGTVHRTWFGSHPRYRGSIRLIVSTLPGRPLDAIRKLAWQILDVEPLTVSERNALITCYLKKYHKELSPGVKEELASAPQSENPLFLRALLDEVRIHGVFEKLADQIRNYLAAQTVDALYEMILARYERDYERDRPGLVKDAVSLLWAARRGLSKSGADGPFGDGRETTACCLLGAAILRDRAFACREGRAHHLLPQLSPVCRGAQVYFLPLN